MTMPILAVFLMMGIALIPLVISAIKVCDEKDDLYKPWLIGSLIAELLLVAWAVRSLTMDPIASKTTVIAPSKINNPDGSYVQMIYFTDQEGKSHIINLNTIFQGIVPDDAKIEVVEYKQSGYANISYVGMDACKPTYRVLPR